MRKVIAVLLILGIGFTYCPSGTVVLAEENGEKLIGNEKEEDNSETERSFLHNFFDEVSSFGEKETGDASRKKMQEAKKEKTDSQETSGLKNLLIPQKLDVVIDPWEIDKKGQVYSETYIIRNTGDAAGILTLSGLACRPREKSGVIVMTDPAGLHDSGDKAVYMKMLFNSGEQIIFSQESSQYQRELKPGEELSIHFAGEVNENAFGKWENNDINVSVVYSWKMEKSADVGAEYQEEKIMDDAEDIEEKLKLDSESVASEKETKNAGNAGTLEKADLNLEENEKETETDEETAKPEEDQQPGADEAGKVPHWHQKEIQESPFDANAVQEPPSNGNGDAETEQSETADHPENNPQEKYLEATMQELQPSQNDQESSEQDQEEYEKKNIGLLEPQRVEVLIDSWKQNEKGQIVSPEYLLYNSRETTGIWSLSKLVCKSQEGAGVVIQKEKDSRHKEEGKCVYMELVIGNGDKVVVSQEDSQYKVELKPGEKLSVRFVGEQNGNLFENREEGDIAVTAVCTWELKQAVAEP